MVDVRADDFDRLFDDTFAKIKPLVERGEEADQDETAEPVRGVGEALDGHLKVTAKPGGTIESVELNPRALRSASEDIAQAITEATNAALADLQQKLSEAVPQAPDTQDLMEQLKEFQNQSVVQMHRYLSAIADVQETIERDADRD